MRVSAAQSAHSPSHCGNGFVSILSRSLCSNSLAAAKSLQSCPTLCNRIDGSPPGSSVPGILQTRALEWVAVPSSRGSFQPRDRTHVSYASCTGNGFFTTSATWEDLLGQSTYLGEGTLPHLELQFPPKTRDQGSALSGFVLLSHLLGPVCRSP